MRDTDCIDGGVICDSSDSDAPKVMRSTEMVSFDCSFSTVADCDRSRLSGMIFRLCARLCGESVQGEYSCRGRDRENIKKAFVAPRSFMKELYNIASENDLFSHNGHHYRVSGLPPHFGASLEIEFASGESVSAGNNQTNFISRKSGEELEALFAKYAGISEDDECLWQSITFSRSHQNAGKCFYIDVFADGKDEMTVQGYCISPCGKRCEAEEPFVLSRESVTALRALRLEAVNDKKKKPSPPFDARDKEKRELVLWDFKGNEREKELSEKTICDILEILVPEFEKHSEQ
ncbi:MAG: hypothetical protein IKL24_03835 [Clostridia bacterium]|nr:hypothetical protein [Clostridia bacterium]